MLRILSKPLSRVRVTLQNIGYSFPHPATTKELVHYICNKEFNHKEHILLDVESIWGCYCMLIIIKDSIVSSNYFPNNYPKGHPLKCIQKPAKSYHTENTILITYFLYFLFNYSHPSLCVPRHTLEYNLIASYITSPQETARMTIESHLRVEGWLTAWFLINYM